MDTTVVADLDLDLNGKSGNDTLVGAGGNDRIFGGAGSDTMNGGGGSDLLNGGSDGDTLIYNLTANSAAGTADVYMGGSGKDTLILQFTRAEWLRPETQSQIAAYLAHLAAVTDTKTGEVSNGLANDFVFTFGTSKLTVQMMENLRVFVDEHELTAANDIATAAADNTTTTEDGPAVDVYVLGNDVVPDLVASLALQTGPAHGTATLVMPDGNDPSSWYFHYEPNTAYYQYLGVGDSTTDAFTYKVIDANGDWSVATVSITLTGTNDAPIVAATDVTGGVTELLAPAGNLTDSGTIAFTDVDLTDVHSVGAVTASAGALGSLTAGVSTDTTGSGAGGVVSWSYSVAASALEYLAKDQTKVETFTFDISDGNGGTVQRTVSVTLTGTNDAPDIQVVTTDSAAETLTETNAGLISAGTLTVTDADLSDTVASSVTNVTLGGSTGSLTAAAVLGFLSLSPTSGLAADTGDTHNLTWNFNSGSQAFDYLGVGQTLTLAYTVESSDGKGGTDTQQVSITISGTADGPVIASLPTAFGGADSNDNDNAGLGPLSSAQVGTGGNDLLRGTNGPDVINGGSGNDDIYGYGGNDTITGGDNNDKIYGGSGNDTIDGNVNNDEIYGGSGNDTIHGNANVDTIYGGSGDDIIFGDENGDTLIGGYGADTMNGGAGSDTFLFLDLKDTNDTINGFASGDKLDLSAIASGDADGAFNWGGQQTGATVQANSVTWFTSAGNVVVLADTDGDVTTAEFMVTLTGITSIAQTDFVL